MFRLEKQTLRRIKSINWSKKHYSAKFRDLQFFCSILRHAFNWTIWFSSSEFISLNCFDSVEIWSNLSFTRFSFVLKCWQCLSLMEKWIESFREKMIEIYDLEERPVQHGYQFALYKNGSKYVSATIYNTGTMLVQGLGTCLDCCNFVVLFWDMPLIEQSGFPVLSLFL
jgi:hypothetical protein